MDLHCHSVNSYLYINRIEIYKFKMPGNIRWYKLCLRSVSQDLTKNEQSQIFLNDTVYTFLIDHSSVRKEI